MNERRARRIHDLFAEVLEKAPDERGDFLERACAEETREEVEALLRAHDTMGDFLATPAPERLAPDVPAALPPGSVVGHYRILRVAGSGGAGTVYEAEQKSPQRKVALKVRHGGLSSETAVQRFRQESEILARLEHPNVAHIYEAGIHEGQPFFAMEYVAGGKTLLEHGRELRLRGRLVLFSRICDAIHHGHQKGIIHCDIKPANVLVDAAGQPKIIDFGIARTEDAAARREIAGTMAYMSPEQCDVGAHLDVRSDVYSLGVLLYQLLAGRPPYAIEGASITEACRIIREAPPAPLGAGLPADLEAIAKRALAKNREDRYASAAALADDIRRYLGHWPVEARPAGFFYVLGRFARRRRTAFLATTAVVVVSIVAALVASWLALEKERQRRAAEAAREKAEYQTYLSDIAAASAAIRARDVATARYHLDEAPPAHRGWEWRHLRGRLDTSERTPVRAGVPLHALGLHGSRLAYCDTDAIHVGDLETGRTLATAPTTTGTAESLAFSPDGNLLAVGYPRRVLELRDGRTGALLRTLAGHGGNVTMLAFDPAGARLASSCYDGAIRIWEPRDGSLLRTIRGHEGKVFCVAFSPDGHRLASGGEDGTIRFWDPETGAETRRIDAHERNVEDVAFDPDGARIVSGGVDGAVRVWDTGDGARIADWRAHTNFVKAVDFHPDGRRVLSASIDGTVRIFDLQRAQELACHVGHASWVYEAVFHADGARIVSAGLDAMVKVWRADEEGAVPTLYGHRRGVHSLRFLDGGARLYSADLGAEVRLWDVPAHRLEARAKLAEDRAGGLEIRGTGVMREVWWDRELAGVSVRSGEATRTHAPLSGGRLLCGAATGRLGLRVDGAWRWSEHREPEAIVAIAASPAEDVAVTATDEGRLRVWTLPDLVPVAGPDVRAARVRAVAVWGGRVAASQWGGDTLVVPDWRAGSPAIALRAHANALAFSPDGRRLATAETQRVRLWDPRNGRQVLVLEGHSLYTSSLAWSPDGSILASGGGDNFPDACVIRLWSAGGN